LTLLIGLFSGPASLQAADGGGVFDWLKQYPERLIRRIRPPKKKLDTPSQLEKRFEGVKANTFNGNDSKRDEEVDISRPLKQAGLAVFDGQVQIVRTFLAFQAADLIRKGSKPVATKAFDFARKVLGKMGVDHVTRVSERIVTSSWGAQLAQNLGAKSLKDLAFRESNFALMTLVAVLFNSAFYDGLDIDSVRDRVDATSSLVTDYTYGKEIPGQMIAGELVNRTFYGAFEKSWNSLYSQALKTKSSWGHLLRNADDAVGAVGQKLFKANRVPGGAVQGESFGKKLGLVGVGEGVELSLSGLAGRFVIGAGMATVGTFAIESIGQIIKGTPDRMYLGGDRNNFFTRQELASYLVQRTGNKAKDWWQERALRLKDLWDQKLKWPIRTVMGPTAALIGAYIGSVAAGALFVGGGAGVLIGGTLVSSLFAGLGNFVGNWVATKLDRSKTMMSFRRSNYERMIRREILEMPSYKDGRLPDTELDRIVTARALDFEKIESTGYAPDRLFLVDRLENVRVYQNGDYLNLHIEDEHGIAFDRYADIRWQFIDLDGWRGAFDIQTQSVINVGKVSENNGRGLVFVDADKASIEGDRLVPSEESGLYVFDNGIIMVKKTPYALTLTPEQRKDPEKNTADWTVHSHGAAHDIFLRGTGERYAFNDSVWTRVGTVPADGFAAQPRNTTPDERDPLAGYAQALQSGTEESIKMEIVHQSQIALEKTLSGFEAHLGSIQDTEALDTYLHQSGIDQMEGEGLVRLSDSYSLDERVEFMRVRVKRFVQRLGTSVGKGLSSSSPDEIADSYRDALQITTPAEEHANDPQRLYNHARSRAQRSQMWGLLSLLSTPDALTLAAFDPVFDATR